MSDLKNPNFPTELLDHSLNREDRRNLVDEFKYWTNEDIFAELDTRRHNFAVVLENFAYDFNIATAIRNSNAFLAKEIFMCGKKKWDKRGAVGTHKYQRLSHYLNWEELMPVLNEKDYTPVVFDNIDGAVSLTDFVWPENPAMIFGAESVGVSPDSLKVAEHVVYIPQFGSTRSLNVGTSSGIAMYDWCLKNT